MVFHADILYVRSRACLSIDPPPPLRKISRKNPALKLLLNSHLVGRVSIASTLNRNNNIIGLLYFGSRLWLLAQEVLCTWQCVLHRRHKWVEFHLIHYPTQWNSMTSWTNTGLGRARDRERPPDPYCDKHVHPPSTNIVAFVHDIRRLTAPKPRPPDKMAHL
jgi:hypothetical protein